MLSNLVLDLNNALMATFRFAAGQKSISADDLVVFAEMFYLRAGKMPVLTNSMKDYFHLIVLKSLTLINSKVVILQINDCDDSR